MAVMSDEEATRPDVQAARRALRRAALLTAGAGIGFGVLSILAWYLLRQDREAFMGADSTVAYYGAADSTTARLAGLYLLPFAAILFLWFTVALRGWVRGTQRRRNMLISDLQLVSGAVFTAIFLIGAAAVATSVIVLQSEAETIPATSLQALSAFGASLMGIMGVRMAAIFVISTASLGLTTGSLPRWFSFLSYGFGLILMLTPVVEADLIIAFPLWVIVLSVMLLYHLAHVPTEEIPGFALRYADPTASGSEDDQISD